jgi:CheY-like chemotaxis protein
MPSPASIIALADDLMVASRIEAACRASGWPVAFPSSADHFWAAVRARTPALVLVAMSATRLPWEQLVRALKDELPLKDVPVLGVGSHMDLSLRQRALAAGCDRVVANSQLAADFPGLLLQMGLVVPGKATG